MQSISAAIHIQGPTIRYAEIGREGSALELRRLGAETVDLNGRTTLFGEEEAPDVLDQARAVVREAVEDTEASAVGLVVHPLDIYSFFVPISTDLSDREREQRIEHQAALVTNTRSRSALHTTARSVRTVKANGETVEWVHVLAVPQAVEEHLETLVSALSGQDLVRFVSTEAVAALMGRAETERDSSAESEGAYRLAIGHYPTHTEYALTHRGEWFHAHAAQDAQNPENQAYYAVGVLNRIGVPLSEIRELFVYGPDADPAAGSFETVFDRSPVLLDPFELLRWTSEPPGNETPGAYVPCIGGALGVQSE